MNNQKDNIQEKTPGNPKKKHIGWIIVAIIVAIAVIWSCISAIVSVHRRNSAPLPKQVYASSSTNAAAEQSAKTSAASCSVHYRYDKSTRILYVTGDTTSWKWLIPFIDTSTPLGRQAALLAASGDNVASIMVYYILSTSPTVSSGKVSKVKLALPNGGRTDYYFLTSHGKTTRINAFKVTYNEGLITSIGDRAFTYNTDGLLRTVGNVLTMQFANKNQMSSMKLTDNLTTSQYQFDYQYKGNAATITFNGTNSLLNFKESGTVKTTFGNSSLMALNNGTVNYIFEIGK